MKILQSSLILLSASAVALADTTLIEENFDGYGVDKTKLATLEGGVGWQGPWEAGRTGTNYEAINFKYSSADGYTSTGGTSAEDGSASAYASAQEPVSRTFAMEPVSGTIWVSFLAYIASTNSVTDQILLQFQGADGTKFSVGQQQGKFGIFKSGKPVTTASEPFPQGGQPNLVIAKIDTAAGKVDAWLNPTEVTTEEALTASPISASADIAMGDAVQPRLTVILREDSSQRAAIDALRIAFGDDSAAALNAVTQGEAN